MPKTVYTLIQNRLQRLSEPAQRILGAAVATGREFEFDVVARASALPENTALDAIDELQRAGLIVPLDGLRFTFDHPLTIEVAYREVGEPRHLIFHRRVAEAMESIYSPRHLNDVAGVLAFHYSEGRSPQKAAPYALTAARQAAKLNAWQEASAFYQQAMVGQDPEPVLKILVELSDLHLRTGHAQSAVETFQQAISLAGELHEHELENRARLGLGNSLLLLARLDEAIALAQQITPGRSKRDPILTNLLWGTALSIKGKNLEAAESRLQTAEKYCRDMGAGEDQEVRAHIRFELGNVAAQKGDLQRAVKLFQDAREIACSVADDRAASWCILAYNNIAYHLHLLGSPDAENYAQVGLEMAQEKGMLGQMPFLYSTLGEIALSRDELEAAGEYFRTGLDLAKRLSISERTAGLTANLARLEARRNNPETALQLYEESLSQSEALGLYHLASQIRLWMAPLVPRDQARELIDQVRAHASQRGSSQLLEEIRKAEELLQNR